MLVIIRGSAWKALVPRPRFLAFLTQKEAERQLKLRMAGDTRLDFNPGTYKAADDAWYMVVEEGALGVVDPAWGEVCL